jgi:hypothetical protein
MAGSPIAGNEIALLGQEREQQRVAPVHLQRHEQYLADRALPIEIYCL